MQDDIVIGSLLIFLVGMCFWLGYRYALHRAFEVTIKILADDGVIRLVEDEDGETEVYSGSKFYNEKREF